LSVNDPVAAKKAREAIYKSIAKSGRILQALVKLVKTHGSERSRETTHKGSANGLTHRPSSIVLATSSRMKSTVLREIEVTDEPSYSKRSDPTRKRAKRVREALGGKTASRKAKTDDN
jgi:hypothetical protein